MSSPSWLHSSNDAPIPSTAFVGGHDSDGSPIYVGRSHHEGDLLPAKVIPSKRAAYVSKSGQEIFKTHFEVLQSFGQNFRWQHSANGYIPPNAVQCGRTIDGEELFIGRGHWESSLTVGKVHPSHQCLYIAYGGVERQLRNFEILVSDQQPGDFKPAEVHPGGPPYTPSVVHPSFPPFYPPIGTPDHPPTPGFVIPVIPLMPHSPPNPIPTPFDQGPSAPIFPHCPPPPPYEYKPLVEGVTSTTPPPPPRPFVPIVAAQDGPDVWIPTFGYTIPPNAIFAGTDTDLSTIYVGRAFHEGDLLPAKVIPSKGTAYVSYGGEEIQKDKFEILTGIGFEWIPSHDGYVPPDAIAGGRTVDGETLYVGRGHHFGSITPGKVQPSQNCLYIPFSRKEVKLSNYDILVRRVGRMLDM